VRVYLVNVAAVLLLGLIVGCGPSLPNYDYSKEPDPRRSEYVIGVGDSLNINVWKNPSLSGTVVVRPDGTVTMPLVGDLRAQGKTPSQLRTEITKRVSEYVKLDGSGITIAVAQVNSYSFTISGQVGKPGMVSSKQYLTIAEAIAQAGGFTRFAQRDKIVLTRRTPDGKVKRIPIVYEFIENGTHPEMNLVMLAGDSLHVP
jgi:polysaccharide export outer membrane protein